jgi:hypothetical protein
MEDQLFPFKTLAAVAEDTKRNIHGCSNFISQRVDRVNMNSNCVFSDSNNVSLLILSEVPADDFSNGFIYFFRNGE